MDKLGITFLAVALILTFSDISDAATAKCTCSGRCGTFYCSNPNNTRGCDCVRCRCIPGRIGFRRCCKSRCGFWNRTKCFRCQIWETCDCNGCR